MKSWSIGAVLTALLLLPVLPLAAGGQWEIDEDGYHPFEGLAGFTEVTNNTRADLTVIPGMDWHVRGKGDREKLEQLRFRVRGDALVIDEEWRLFNWGGRRVRLEIRLPELEGLTSAGSGDARVAVSVTGERLILKTTGSGEIEAGGDVGRLELQVTGAGDLAFRGSARTALISSTGAADMDVDLNADELEVRMTGAGDLSLRGGAGRASYRLTGAGDLEASDFPVRRAVIILTGAGEADIRVSESLEATLTGAGDLTCLGSPPDVRTKVSGSGRVSFD